MLARTLPRARTAARRTALRLPPQLCLAPGNEGSMPCCFAASPLSAAGMWRQRGGKGRPLPTTVGRRRAGCPWPGYSAPWEPLLTPPTPGQVATFPRRAAGVRTCRSRASRYQVVVAQLPDLAAPIPLPSRLLDPFTPVHLGTPDTHPPLSSPRSTTMLAAPNRAPPRGVPLFCTASSAAYRRDSAHTRVDPRTARVTPSSLTGPF